jgi:hypothetical protein
VIGRVLARSAACSPLQKKYLFDVHDSGGVISQIPADRSCSFWPATKKYWQGGAATLFGIFSPLGALLSVEFQIAVQRSLGLPLTVLAGQVGNKIRNHANSAQ